jgi:tRNA-dependent cyclodipeptide synthase
MILDQNGRAAEDAASLAAVIAFLNRHNVKYTVRDFSPFFEDEEVQREGARLGLGLLQAVPVEISGARLALAIIPSSLTIDQVQFCKLLVPDTVRVLDSSDSRQRYLSTNTKAIPPFPGLFGLESFLSPLVEQNRTVGFFADSRNSLITMETSEFCRLLFNPSAVPVPTRPKYRAYASPSRKANKHCILGVSLENDDFHTTKLITMTEWISKHYHHCIVMLGDGLHRLTLQMDFATSEDESLEQSKWLARDFVRSQFSVFGLERASCRFDFKFASEIQQTSCYANHYHRLSTLACDAGGFHNSLAVFSKDFLERKPQRQENREKHLEMSRQYLLEELAVICCLAQDHPCTFIYPGSLTILEEIAQGKHPYLPEHLLQIDYVELKLKNREKR